MIKSSNNYAFIDSQNVNLAIRDLGWRLDFARFRVYLVEHYGVGKDGVGEAFFVHRIR